MEDSKILLGELRGQLSSLLTLVNNQTNVINSLDTRLRKNEDETTKLTVKMTVIGIVAGGFGSFATTFILKIIFKT